MGAITGRRCAGWGRPSSSLGVKNGDKMAILSGNRPEWHFADVGCMSIGAASAPFYVTNSPEQVRHVISDSDSRLAVVENGEQLEKVLKVRGELPALEKVIVFEGYEGDVDGDFVMTWAGLPRSRRLHRGREVRRGARVR